MLQADNTVSGTSSSMVKMRHKICTQQWMGAVEGAKSRGAGTCIGMAAGLASNWVKEEMMYVLTCRDSIEELPACC